MDLNNYEDGSIQFFDDENQKETKLSSNYDFVKVKVWIGDHHYVLSRFLVSRMLMMTKVYFQVYSCPNMSSLQIPTRKAIKIALELKKRLVDRFQFNISQGELEQVLFDILRERKVNDKHIERFKIMSIFFRKRISVIILLCGSGITQTVRSIGALLAESLNFPNVIQADLISECLSDGIGGKSFGGGGMFPISYYKDTEGKETLELYNKECSKLILGLEGDLRKCVEDGKSVIIAGMHLSPTLFRLKLYELLKTVAETGEQSSQPRKRSSSDTSTLIGITSSVLNRKPDSLDGMEILTPSDDMPLRKQAVLSSPKLESRVYREKDQDFGNHCILFPCLVTLAGSDYEIMVTEWMLYNSGECETVNSKLMDNLLAIQNFSRNDFNESNVTPINIENPEETADIIHEMVLDNIIEFCKGHFGKELTNIQ